MKINKLFHNKFCLINKYYLIGQKKKSSNKDYTKFLIVLIDFINFNQSLSKLFNIAKRNSLIIDDLILPSRISALSKDQTALPFWNNKIQKLADKLFFPTHNNLTKNNNCIKSMNNTWFESNYYANNKTSYNLKFSKQPKDFGKITKCKKIIIYMTPKQKKYLKIIIGTYRYFYNRCIAFFNNYNKETRESYFFNNDIRINIIIPVNQSPYNVYYMYSILKKDKPDWILDGYPSHLIDEAIFEAFTRFNTCLSNFKKKNCGIFKMKYKTKKEKIQTIHIEKLMINGKTNSIFSNWKIENEYLYRNLKTSEKINKYNYCGSSISYNIKLRKVCLNLSYEDSIKENNINKKICALDPNVRKFLVLYSNDRIVQIGNRANEKLAKKCKEIDIMKSRIDKRQYYIKNDKGEKNIIKINSEKRRNLIKAMHRKIDKIKNMKNELHNKTINYLCTNYTTIILPPYEIKNMVVKLNSKVARAMYSYSYYSFKEKLIKKAKEMNVYVLIKSEHYTSQTCGKCGNLYKTDQEIYKCRKCNTKIDRDNNAARNILLKNIKYA